MRQFFFLLISCFISFASSSQNTLGIKASGGASKISTTLQENLTVHKDHFNVSGATGLYYNMYLKKQSLLGAEVLFMVIRGKEHSEMYESGQAGNLTGNYAIEDITRQIIYLSVPLYYGFKYKKLNMNIGVQASFSQKSWEKTEGTRGQNSVSSNYSSRTEDLNITDYDFEPRAGLMFYISDNLCAEAVYLYGINSILKSNPMNDKWKIQQLNIGLRFTFYEIVIDPKKINAVLD